MRLSIIIKGLVTFVFVIIVTLGAILYSTDFSQYKSEISVLVEALTDRKLVLRGNFKVSLGLKPAIAASAPG